MQYRHPRAPQWAIKILTVFIALILISAIVRVRTDDENSKPIFIYSQIVFFIFTKQWSSTMFIFSLLPSRDGNIC